VLLETQNDNSSDVGQTKYWMPTDETSDENGGKVAVTVIGTSKNGRILYEKSFGLSCQEMSAANSTETASVFNGARWTVARCEI
jgi:hypothetical protein